MPPRKGLRTLPVSAGPVTVFLSQPTNYPRGPTYVTKSPEARRKPMPDIRNNNEVAAERERNAYNRIMRAMLTLEEPSRMKVLGAVAIMIKPALAPEPPSAAPTSEQPT